MEALPVERDVAFVGIDEAQLGADPERGHVFTDRLLRARGRGETMILGSASIRGLVKELVREVEIITRQIGRAHVCTPVPNAHLVCRLLLDKKKQKTKTK